MRKNDKRNRKYVILAFLSLSLFIMLFLVLLKHHKREETMLHEIVVSFQNTGELIAPEDIMFSSGSGEALFLQGLYSYAEHQYEDAIRLFETSLNAPFKDPSLEVYGNYYINECLYYSQNRGNFNIVKEALSSMARLPYLSNNTDLLSDLLYGITLSDTDTHQAAALLQAYMEKARSLTPVTIAWIYNYIGVSEYTFQDYDKSIRYFYDAEAALKGLENNQEAAWHLRYTKEYIANIFYLFNDYENAISQYLAIIDMTKLLKEETSAEYNSMINLANCYIKLGHYREALKTLYKLENALSSLDPLLIPEVQAAIDDVYANIYLFQGRIPRSKFHLKKALDYYDKDNIAENAFSGGSYYVLITKCRFLLYDDKIQEAVSLLEEFLSSKTPSLYGLEDDAYLLLEEAYQILNDEDKLLQISTKIREADNRFLTTLQKEYLEFSQYYKENNDLISRTVYLTQLNNLLVLIICITLLVLSGIIIFMLIIARLSTIDSLTGLYNRKKLNRLFKRYAKHGTPAHLAVIMMDIDYFKKYNDMYGHPAGDVVLAKSAKTIASSVRKRDIVIRYGGEEFLVLIPDVTYNASLSICERIRDNMKHAALPHGDSPISEFITLSIGMVYQKEASSHTLEELLSKADECLYISKENGRNTATSMDLKKENM